MVTNYSLKAIQNGKETYDNTPSVLRPIRMARCALQTEQTQSAVIRSLIENGTVRERITKEHIHIIRQLIGESTNLNQLAKQANTYGFFAVAKRCEEMAQRINQLIKRLKDDR
jgi:hypothetical protein